MLIAVPRFCERVRQGVEARSQGSPVRRLVWKAALALGRGGTAGGPRRNQRFAARLADRLVLSRVRAAFGGELRFIVSGSAPLPADLLAWFDAIGIPLVEAYGTSEDIVPVATATLADRCPGTVGRPLPENEVRLDPDGEVLLRGPGVFDPELPDNRARAQAIDAEGFLHTGDLASFDAHGHLRLLGRRREVFKGADGRWIVPTSVEAVLRTVPGVAEAAVFAHDLRVVAVLAPAAGAATTPRGDAGGVRSASLEAAVRRLAPAERPAACLVVPRGFSVAGGELTTNLKLRRAFIAAKYARALDDLLATAHDGPALGVLGEDDA
jgi:long-chain acyl-CoA synthetase